MLQINYENVFFQLQRLVEKDPLNKIARNVMTPNKGHYKYIPINSYTIMTMMQHLSETKTSLKNLRFVDAGCGYPLLLRFMEMFGCETTGIEFNPVLTAMFPELLYADICVYDRFNNADIIFAYHPMTDTKLMQKAIKNIKNTMKSGAIFYFACAGNHDVLGKGLTLTKNHSSLYYYLKK